MNWSKWWQRYDAWFSLEEIYKSKTLKACLAAVLLSYFVTFKLWVGEFRFTTEAVEQGLHLCWPYFKSCGDWYFLSGLPYSYTANIFYMVFFGLIGWSAWAMWNNQWRLAHTLLWPMFIWKVLMVLMFSMAQMGNYEYYHIIFTAILLFCPHKAFFLKFSLVWFYFLSTAVKIHPTWTLGIYFTSLKTGLPILPDALMPLWTNLVTVMEMVAAWWLLGPKNHWQRLVFVFFVIFHLYSGVLVSYRYPSTVLPLLFILFGPWYEYTRPPKGWGTLPGWLLIGFIGSAQTISHFIPGDEKVTMEGNFYGLYMFEANHQCVEKATTYRAGQDPEVFNKESFQARNRCDPYRLWFKHQQRCAKDPTIDRVAMEFDHSINGGPFFKIVDIPNICGVDYKPFSHNKWIEAPTAESEELGYPMKNYYY